MYKNPKQDFLTILSCFCENSQFELDVNPHSGFHHLPISVGKWRKIILNKHMSNDVQNSIITLIKTLLAWLSCCSIQICSYKKEQQLSEIMFPLQTVLLHSFWWNGLKIIMKINGHQFPLLSRKTKVIKAGSIKIVVVLIIQKQVEACVRNNRDTEIPP